MTTTVINIKSLRGAFPRDENDVYIGRNMIWTKYKLSESKWHNPLQYGRMEQGKKCY